MLANVVFSLLLGQFLQAHCYKILIYAPKMGHSHVNFLGRIADTLVEAGHDVVMLIPEFDPDVKTNGTRLARTIHRERDFSLPESRTHFLENAWAKKGEDFSEVLRMVRILTDTQRVLCEHQLKDEQMLENLRSEKFDLGITEVISACGYAIFAKIGLKKYASAFATNLIETVAAPFGIESNPAFVPASFSPSSDEMGYLERVTNLVIFVITKILTECIAAPNVIAVIKKHLNPNFVPEEVLARSIFVFVNADEFLEFPRPINHKIIYIGGIAVPKPEPLDAGYQKIMDAAEGGVVLISFGSVAKSSLMRNETKAAFVSAFKKLPNVTFVWKYEVDDNVASGLTNVFKRKWVPQNDLLAHKNVRALVSHCGLNSLTESANAGVPLICIPLFGDQMRNAKIAEKRGIGVILDKTSIKGDAVFSALKKVLYGKSFQDASSRLSRMILKKPVPVKERLIKYIEFAAEFGVIDNLDPASRKLNFFQYYLIDIVVPFSIILSLFIYSATRVIKWLLGKVIIYKIKKD